jgi:hypothetical protein
MLAQTSTPTPQYPVDLLQLVQPKQTSLNPIHPRLCPSTADDDTKHLHDPLATSSIE